MAYQADKIPLQAKEKIPYFWYAKDVFFPISHLQ